MKEPYSKVLPEISAI